MGIFSFGKKDDPPTRRGANTSSTRAARGERVERRTRRTERPDADAMLLDPTLPEKQRARRRLVGAIAMVVAAVVILPMVLDSHPKPVTDDIAIEIPNRPAPKVSADEEDTQAGVAPDNPVSPDTKAASGQSATGGIAPAPAPAASAVNNSTKQPAGTSAAATKSSKSQTSATVANTAPATTSVAPAKPAKTTPAPTQGAANASAYNSANNGTNSSAASADADSGTPASPPGSRFAVQLGSFPDEANAKTWASKLKAAGVPAYTEHRKQADGSTVTLLRAGPFADRAAASAAIAKVRAAGLTSGSSNGAAQ